MWELEFPRPESDSGSGAAEVGSIQLAEGVPTRPFAGVENKAAREDSGRWSLSQVIAITSTLWGGVYWMSCLQILALPQTRKMYNLEQVTGLL